MNSKEILMGIAQVMHDNRVPFDSIGLELNNEFYLHVLHDFREHEINEVENSFIVMAFGYKFKISREHILRLKEIEILELNDEINRLRDLIK